MVTEIGEEWVVDTEAMTCLNKNTEVLVEFQEKDELFIGSVKHIPINLMKSLAMLKNGEKLVRKAVMEAEEIFWMVKYD
jgi:precorrin-6B methylase 2